MASFKELLQDKRKKFEGESDRVAIAEAGSQHSSNIQSDVDKKFKQEIFDPKTNETKFDRVSSAVRGIPDSLRGDIQGLEDGSYQDLVRFFRKYDRFNNEVQGGRLYNDQEKEYIEQTIKAVVDELADLQGPVARAAFAFEDFKSQFKPLKLADRFLGDLPLIGGMIRERVQAKQEADRLARSTGLRAKKEELSGERKAAAQFKPMEDNFVDTSSAMEQHMAEDHSSSSSPIVSKTPGGMFDGSEESQKEQLNREEEKMDLFRTIADATMKTQYAVEDLLEAYKDENEGMGEIMDQASGLGGAAVGGAAGAGGLLGVKSIVNKTKSLIKGGKDKVKNMTKGAGKAAGKFGKAALRGLKFIPGIGLIAAGGMGLYDGVRGFNADKDASFGKKLVNTGSSVLSGLTFGLLGSSPEEIAAAENELSNSDISKSLNTPNAENQSQVDLGQVFQINADQVMLKANSMKQLQDENDTIKTVMSSGQGGTQNNSVINQVTNTAKSQFLGPNLHSVNPRNIAKSIF